MENYDVIISGAGPSGATAGILLAQKGLRVLVLDRKQFPRFKLCGGLLTWKTQEFLSRVFGIGPGYLKKHNALEACTQKYGLGMNRLPRITGRMRYPFLLINRSVYDNMLVRRLVSAGAVFRSPETVKDIDPESSRVVLGNGERIRASFIIGADGALSTVRRKLAGRGIVHPPWSRQSALALEMHVCRSKNDFPEYPCIHLGQVPSGYFWSFPGREKQCLGLGSNVIRNGNELKEIFNKCCAIMGVNVPVKNLKAHVLPYGDFEPRPGVQNILLCGDAAGLADPLLGEGIFYAHYSAMLASRAVLRSWKQPENAAKEYFALMQEVVTEMRYARMWRKLTLNVLSPCDFAPFRLLMHRYSRQLVETIHGLRSFKWLRTRNWSGLSD